MLLKEILRKFLVEILAQSYLIILLSTHMKLGWLFLEFGYLKNMYGDDKIFTKSYLNLFYRLRTKFHTSPIPQE